MPTAARLCLSVGVLGLALCVANQLSAPELTPALERSSVLASLLSVGLMLVAILWTRAVPLSPERVELTGEQRLELASDLPQDLQQELGWGSQLLLTATPAASILVLWRGQLLLQRGMLSTERFKPGAICQRALSTQKAISLVNLKLYPGRDEFIGLPTNVPAVIVQPIADEGMVVLGGWSARCFSRSDEAWLEGWSQKLRTQLESLDAVVPPAATSEG